MNKFKNPFSFVQLFCRYHKKHLYKVILCWLIITLLVSYINYHMAKSTNVWSFFILTLVIFFSIIYFFFLAVFIVYYYANIYPYKFLLFLRSPLFLKSILVVVFLLAGLPIVLGKYNLDIDDMKNVLTLSWTIFGISVTYALVTYFLVIEKLSKEKSSTTKLGKMYYNASVLLSLSTFFMLAVNVFLLSGLSLMIFITNSDVTRMNQILSKFTFWFSINVVGSTTYDFIGLLIMKKKEIEFASAELALEKNEIEQRANEFSELRKKMKLVTSSYNIIEKKRKKTEKILDDSAKLIKEIETFIQKSQDNPNSISDLDVRLIVKKITRLAKAKKEVYTILSEIKKMESDFNGLNNQNSYYTKGENEN